MDRPSSSSRIPKSLRRLLICVGVLLPTLLGWIFAPLPRLRDDIRLLALLPPEPLSLGLEARRLGSDLDDLMRSGVLPPDALPPLLTGALQRADIRLPVDPEPWLASPRRSLFRWLLNHEAAIAVSLPRTTQRAAIIRLDNLSRALLWASGHASLDGRNRLAARVLGQPEAVAAYRDRLLLIASSTELLDAMLARQARPSPDDGWPPLSPCPQRGLLVRYRKPRPGDRADAAATTSPGAIETLDACLSRSGAQLSFRCRTTLDPRQTAAVLIDEETARCPLTNAPLPSLGSGDVAGLDGSLAPGMTWRTLSRLGWPQTGAPSAGSDDPMLTLAWQVFHRALAQETDGRFAVRVRASRPARDALAVPEFLGRLGVHDAERAARVLNSEAARLVELFRAPGGNALWESVRRHTELRPGDAAGTEPTQVRLHPVFFHGMQPWWRPARSGSLVGGSHWPPTPSDTPPPAGAPSLPSHARALPTDPSVGGVLAALSAAWRIPPTEAEAWTALLVDKIQTHGWIEIETRPVALSAIARFRALLESVPSGHLKLSFRRDASRGPGPAEPAELSNPGRRAPVRFCLDISGCVGVDSAPLIRSVNAPAAPHPAAPRAEVAEWQTR